MSHVVRADAYRSGAGGGGITGSSGSFQGGAACDESYYMHASSDDYERAGSHKQPRSKRIKRFFPLLALLVLGAIITAVAVTVRSSNSNNSSDSTSAPSNSSSSSSSTSANGSTSATKDNSSSSSTATGGSKPSSCPLISPSERTVVFWQSEVEGCEKVPVGVTHIVWGFALVADGAVVPTFQNSDAYIKSCVKSLRSKCIASLGSIGGSTNNKNLSAAADAAKFAASAVTLVQKFGFDGIDIDDETVGPEFSATRVVALVKATSAALRKLDQRLVLTFDAYFNEGEPTYCTNPVVAAYARCFPTAILPHVDWINIMAYNVNQDAAAAAAVYDKALATTFADWRKQLGGDFTKATFGICAAKSCAYGPGPSAKVVAQWTAVARASGGGGMMVYAASSEASEDFPTTRSVIDAA